MGSLRRLLSSSAGRRILVVGDPILDSFLMGSAARLCSEAPVPVVVRSGETDVPGGAANVAANLHSLGATPRLAGVLGRDVAAGRLRASMAARGLELAPELTVEDGGRHTAHKLRILAGRQYLVRVDQEPEREVDRAAAARLAGVVERELRSAESVVVSDYGYGSAGSEALAALASGLRRRGRPLVIDAKDLSRHAELRPTVVTPNLVEAQKLASRTAGAREIAPEVLARCGAEWALITVGGEGALLASRSGDRIHFPAWRADAASEVGAGDTVVATLALALAGGAPMRDAARLAMAAAAVAVSKPLTAVVTASELADRLAPVEDGGDVVTAQRLAELLERDRRAGRRVVFTNGIFDLLHVGHVNFLRRARDLGDVLVVGVNSDSGARRLKGPGRPLIGERERLALVSSVAGVSHAILYDDLTAEALIGVLRPDVYVKGGGRAEDSIPEVTAAREVGAEVVVLGALDGGGSGKLVRRMRTEAADGAR